MDNYKSFLLFTFVLLLTYINLAFCHGRMDDPPSRNSAWRFFPDFPKDYDDNGLSHPSVCGSKGHESGGRFATGKIVKTYMAGQNINITSVLTANHLGTIEINLCPIINDNHEDQSCFEKHRLEVITSSRLLDNDKYKAKVNLGEKVFTFEVKLPDIMCDHCVLQWYWKAKNTGETFVNCADIRIVQDITTTTMPKIVTKLRKNKKSKKPKSTIAYLPKPLTFSQPKKSSLKEQESYEINTTKSSTILAMNITTTRVNHFKLSLINTIKLFCYDNMPSRKTNNTHSNKYIGSLVLCSWTDKATPMDCELCRDNCIIPHMKCPVVCDCHWYN